MSLYFSLHLSDKGTKAAFNIEFKTFRTLIKKKVDKNSVSTFLGSITKLKAFGFQRILPCTMYSWSWFLGPVMTFTLDYHSQATCGPKDVLRSFLVISENLGKMENISWVAQTLSYCWVWLLAIRNLSKLICQLSEGRLSKAQICCAVWLTFISAMNRDWSLRHKWEETPLLNSLRGRGLFCVLFWSSRLWGSRTEGRI